MLWNLQEATWTWLLGFFCDGSGRFGAFSKRYSCCMALRRNKVSMGETAPADGIWGPGASRPPQ